MPSFFRSGSWRLKSWKDLPVVTQQIGVRAKASEQVYSIPLSALSIFHYFFKFPRFTKG